MRNERLARNNSSWLGMAGVARSRSAHQAVIIMLVFVKIRHYFGMWAAAMASLKMRKQARRREGDMVACFVSIIGGINEMSIIFVAQAYLKLF